MQYKFEYDKFGRTTANKVGNGTSWQTLSKMDYNAAGLLTKQTYGNGDYVDFSYDKFDRQTEKRYNGDNSQRVTYSYGNNGSVAQITDYFTNSNTRFTYDLADRVVSQREYSGTAKNGGTLLSYTDFTYADKTNYLTGIKHFSPLGTQNIGYTFGVQKDGEMPDQIYKVTWNGAEKVKYTYDKLGRLESKHTGSFDTNFTYEDYETIGYNGATEKRTTSLVKSVETPTGTYSYEYDKLGNILSETDGTYTTSYEYDSLNQLTRVNDEKAGKTYTYSYTNGNITEQNEYAYTVSDLGEPLNTKTWEYNNSTWSDLLTNFNGESITYDEIGNPLTIGEKSLTWTGRQLQSITDGDSEIAYTYNGDGLRTSKTVNGETTNYYYNGSILAGQKTGDDTLVFMYDNNSDIFGVIYNDVEYYYIKNAQNDVIGITDADGNVLIKYAYDAWGKITSITKADNTDITDLEDDISQSIFDIATGESTPVLDENGNPVTSASTEVTLARINPILYRSYYYDKETEWYYLNTRYYSPDICRFINADGIVGANQDILSNNLFSYCSNDPINHSDSIGQRRIRNWLRRGLNKIREYANRIFGRSTSSSYTRRKEMRWPNRKSVIYSKTGYESTIKSEYGNSSKPIVYYTNCELSDVIGSSTFGVKYNISKLSIEGSYGFSDTGITLTITDGDISSSITRKINLVERTFVIGNSVTKNWDSSHSSTIYNEVNIDLITLIGVLCAAGQGSSYSPDVKLVPRKSIPRGYPIPQLGYIHLIIEVKL